MKMVGQSPNRVSLEHYFLPTLAGCQKEEKARQWEEMSRVMRSTCSMTYFEYAGLGRAQVTTDLLTRRMSPPGQ